MVQSTLPQWLGIRICYCFPCLIACLLLLSLSLSSSVTSSTPHLGLNHLSVASPHPPSPFTSFSKQKRPHTLRGKKKKVGIEKTARSRNKGEQLSIRDIHKVCTHHRVSWKSIGSKGGAVCMLQWKSAASLYKAGGRG